MKDINWTIEPYAGVGPLKFGLSPEQVIKILGPVEQIRDYRDNDTSINDAAQIDNTMFVEFRSDLEIGNNIPDLNYDENGLGRVCFDPYQESLEIFDTKLFMQDRKKLISQLIKISNHVKRDFTGNYFFMDFGIDLYGHKEMDQFPGICVFRRGFFDEIFSSVLPEDIEDVKNLSN